MTIEEQDLTLPHETDPEGTTGRSAQPTAPWWILFGIAAACYAVFIWRTGFQLDGEWFFTLRDDAMISMRYASNFAEGHGLVWNPGGPRVEGYTNFGWVLWMSALHLLPLPISKVSLAVSVTGALMLLGNGLVVRAIARRLSDETGALVATALTLFYYPLVYWTLRGMEVGLLALLVSGSVLGAVTWFQDGCEKALRRVAVLLSLAVVVRPDAVVPAGVVFLVLVLQARTGAAGEARKPSRGIGLVGLAVLGTFVGHTLFRVGYYGELLPNTYHLKLGGVPLADRIARGLPALALVFKEHLVVPLLVALYGLWRAREIHHVLLWSVFLSASAYSVYVGGDAWEYFRYANRYVAVAMPALFVLVGTAVSTLRAELPAAGDGNLKRPGQLLLMGTLLVLATLSISEASNPRFFDWYRQTHWSIAAAGLVTVGAWAVLYRLRSGGRGYAALLLVVCVTATTWLGSNAAPVIGQWIPRAGAAVAADNARARAGLLISRHTDPDATIAVSAAGNIPYFSGRTTVDLLGKVDPVIARMAPRREFDPGHDRWDYEHSVGELEPDLIVQLWSPSESEYLYMATRGYWDVFTRAGVAPSGGAPCGGYMGSHGLGCACQDGSFFTGLTCDILVSENSTNVDVTGLARAWGEVVRGD